MGISLTFSDVSNFPKQLSEHHRTFYISNRKYLFCYFLQKPNNPTTSTFFRAQAAAAACRKEPLGYYGIAICNPHLTDGPFQLESS